MLLVLALSRTSFTFGCVLTALQVNDSTGVCEFLPAHERMATHDPIPLIQSVHKVLFTFKNLLHDNQNRHMQPFAHCSVTEILCVL